MFAGSCLPPCVQALGLADGGLSQWRQKCSLALGRSTAPQHFIPPTLALHMPCTCPPVPIGDMPAIARPNRPHHSTPQSPPTLDHTGSAHVGGMAWPAGDAVLPLRAQRAMACDNRVWSAGLRLPSPPLPSPSALALLLCTHGTAHGTRGFSTVSHVNVYDCYRILRCVVSAHY